MGGGGELLGASAALVCGRTSPGGKGPLTQGTLSCRAALAPALLILLDLTGPAGQCPSQTSRVPEPLHFRGRPEWRGRLATEARGFVADVPLGTIGSTGPCTVCEPPNTHPTDPPHAVEAPTARQGPRPACSHHRGILHMVKLQLQAHLRAGRNCSAGGGGGG